MKKWCQLGLISVLLVLLVTMVLRGWGQSDVEEGPVLYFTVSEGTSHGSALATEPYTGPTTEFMNIPSPRLFMNALLDGPTKEGLTSPFPKGLSLESWRLDPENHSNLQLRLSEQYNGLTDISLTLADYCIVLTMSQIPGVETVEIQSGGYSASYRSHQLLRADEVELIDSLAKADTSS